ADDFLVEDITLSDGTLVPIDGANKPTLDVRAGVSADAIVAPGITGFDDSPTEFFFDANLNVVEAPPETNTAATSADIAISGIGVSAPDGVVLLSNQYQPNTLLPGGAIEVGEVRVDETFRELTGGGFTGESGSVFIDSRNQIRITNRIETSSDSGNSRGGEIKLLANGDILLTNRVLVDASGNGGGGIEILGESITLTDGSIIVSNTTGSELGREVLVNANQLILTDGSVIAVNSLGDGQAGNLTVNASESVKVIGRSADGESASALRAQAVQGSTGNAGNMGINTPTLLITDGAQVSVSTFGEGVGGSLTINASESVQVISTLAADSEFRSGLAAQAHGKGKAGNLTISTPKLLITDGAFVSAGTLGEGNGGGLTVNVTELVQVMGTSSDGKFASALAVQASRGSTGNAGDFSISTPKLLITDGAFVSASTLGEGDGGSLSIHASESVQVIGISADGKLASGLAAQAQGRGDAGKLTISTAKLLIANGAVVTVGTLGEGDGGNLNVNASESVYVIGESADGMSSSAIISAQRKRIEYLEKSFQQEIESTKSIEPKQKQ
ncbi:MAG: hypothetical protein F6K09_21685, partial [Merismopedia sp. SIO2A8]|nr:hypothetical protein [Merismopedia sp. SIO2A8]